MKAMFVSCFEVNRDQFVNIGVNDTELVNTFVYLGSCIARDSNELLEHQRRITLAN
jgi:hypothetical protein